MFTNSYGAGDSLFQIQEANRDIAKALARTLARLFSRTPGAQPRESAFLSGPSFADQTPSMIQEYISLGRYE